MRVNTIPEMQRTDLAPVLLQLKALGIDNVLRFEFPTPPPSQCMMRALEVLRLYSLMRIHNRTHTLLITNTTSIISTSCCMLWAHWMNTESSPSPSATPSPSCLSDPRWAKWYQRLQHFTRSAWLDSHWRSAFCCYFHGQLLKSGELGCSEEVLSIAAMLSVQMVFVYPRDFRNTVDAVRKRFAVFEGDTLTWLNGTASPPIPCPCLLPAGWREPSLTEPYLGVRACSVQRVYAQQPDAEVV